MTYSAGQVVGQVNEPKTVKQVMYDMLTEYAEAMDRMTTIIESE
ncbi:hypothetical protein [Sinorhizobium meliloti]